MKPSSAQRPRCGTSGRGASLTSAPTRCGRCCSYNADVYVFAVLTAKDHDSYDALDLRQWSFWVLPSTVVEQTAERSLGLAKVEALAGSPVTFAELGTRVREAAELQATRD